MAGVGYNPSVFQGNLNRLSSHIVVPTLPALNVTASYFGKSQAKLTFDGPSTDQIPTATGIVNSPHPYVMAQCVLSLLRSQSLANAWINQFITNCYIDTLQAFSDSSVFESLTITQASIMDFDPGAFDGQDPTVTVTIKGTFFINSSLWATLTGSSGLLAPTI